MMRCDNLKSYLPDLVFDPASVPSSVQQHLQLCVQCRKQADALQAAFSGTMRLLDEWKVPEPSDYFDTRMAVRLREARQTEPAGFFERMRQRMMYGSNMQLRPAMAATLALAIIVGGGSYAGFVSMNRTAGRSQVTSATVHDLQILDANDQTIQQLNAFDDDGPAGNASTGGSVTSN